MSNWLVKFVLFQNREFNGIARSEIYVTFAGRQVHELDVQCSPRVCLACVTSSASPRKPSLSIKRLIKGHSLN